MWRRHDVNFTGNGLVNWNVVSKASFLVTFEGAFMDKEEKYDSVAFGKKNPKTQKKFDSIYYLERKNLKGLKTLIRINLTVYSWPEC